MEVRGQHIWLVGASAGIGAALATQLSAAGATLTLSARSETALNALAQSISGARVLPLDVTDAKSITAAWQVLEASGLPDMVIYNAGAYEPLAATQFDLKKIEQMVDVNFHGALRVLSHVIPAFVTRNGGHIALVGSVAGYRGLPGAMGYGASKAALIHLAENLRADFAATNIRVTIINPGFVKTQLTAKNDFHMPCMVSPEFAAKAIMRGFARDDFEIHFPHRFTRVLKFLRLLPSGIYFRLLTATKF
ncbi:MAG: SDR family NAD(P)-dependent oxidoreductase [Rickettsiales bacterium]|nr:SDR family NAD(P)-dependent oxidoreductase [Rickettsiales bacterium]